MSVRLYVGNLPEELNRQELEAIFAEAGDVSTKIITDRRTNKCRGFGFVTVKSDEQADEIIEKFNGYMVGENPIKIEKANPRTKEQTDKLEEEASGNGNSGNGGSASGRRKGGANKSKRNSNSSSTAEAESVQPDPRWAQELEKLKELLAAQTTNS
jgi:RNA recognition motif-containing protein